MPEIKHRKILKIKFITILFISIFTPVFISLFFKLQPVIIFLLSGVIFLLSSIFIFLLLKPLRSLTEGTSVLSQGNLNFRIDIRSNDELEELGDAFNILAQKLQNSLNKSNQDKDNILNESNKLDLVISSIIDGIIALDPQKKVVFANKAAEEISGYNFSELKEKPVEQIMRFFMDKQEVLPTTYCQSQFDNTLTVFGKNGKQVKVKATTMPVAGSIQSNISCILILHDLTKESELEQMKLDFVSLASHELKTPLTSITGYLSVFVDENKDKIPKEELELVEKSLIASKQLYTLVENILNVNKIERGQITVNIETLDLGKTLQKGIEDLQNQAKFKNISLELILPPQMPRVLADATRIEEVITNLIANSINYTNSGGRIQISATVSPNEITTTISDNGIGIPAEAIPHLFNKFFRVSNAIQKASKGTGLGLYISKSIIEKLGGKIWVESEVGKGSKFHFSLPLAQKISTGMLDSSKFAKDAIQQGALNFS